jgi:hypothetical protein
MGPFRALDWKTVGTHLGVGMASASFWRGAWYVLDDNMFPDCATTSASASLALGVVGMVASQGLVQKSEALARLGSVRRVQVARFAAIYTIALSCVLVWRGTWMAWDVGYEKFTEAHPTEPGHATKSGVLSHGISALGLFSCGLFASVLAPPAAASVIRDLAVRTGQSSYAGPAAKVMQSFIQGPSMQRSMHTSKRRRFIKGPSTQRSIYTLKRTSFK